MMVSVYADKIIVLQYFLFYSTVKQYCISVMSITFEHENLKKLEKKNPFDFRVKRVLIRLDSS